MSRWIGPNRGNKLDVCMESTMWVRVYLDTDDLEEKCFPIAKDTSLTREQKIEKIGDIIRDLIFEECLKAQRGNNLDIKDTGDFAYMSSSSSPSDVLDYLEEKLEEERLEQMEESNA